MKSFNVPLNYRSPLITAVKEYRKKGDKLKKDFTPTRLDLGPLQIYLARHFGFCYGVENAIEIAFRTLDENPGKRIYLLSEMIHNPHVNKDLLDRGVQFLQDTHGKQLIPFELLTADDIVIIPAFGTTLEMEARLEAIGIKTEKYNTTCPFVERVWNRSEQIATKGYTIIIHGKPKHEETRATFSHASENTPALILNDMKDAEALAGFIAGTTPFADFAERFKGNYSEGFDPSIHLNKIGVINQTTQLASDTQAISDFLKKAMEQRFGNDQTALSDYFADTRDTLCYATMDNQTSVQGMLEVDTDLALVIGGYNSSNTTHLVELCELKRPTFFINSHKKMISKNEIIHYNFHTKEEDTIQDFLPAKEPVKISITSGASCPDAFVEDVIRKLADFFGVSEKIDPLIESFTS